MTATMHVAATAQTAAQQHDTVVQITNDITSGLRMRMRVSEAEAARWAEACVYVLQSCYGGERLGPRGLYLPAINAKAQRDDAIRAAAIARAGRGPYTKDLVADLKNRFNCSRRTVQRAIQGGVR